MALILLRFKEILRIILCSLTGNMSKKVTILVDQTYHAGNHYRITQMNKTQIENAIKNQNVTSQQLSAISN